VSQTDHQWVVAWKIVKGVVLSNMVGTWKRCTYQQRVSLVGKNALNKQPARIEG